MGVAGGGGEAATVCVEAVAVVGAGDAVAVAGEAVAAARKARVTRRGGDGVRLRFVPWGGAKRSLSLSSSSSSSMPAKEEEEPGCLLVDDCGE